MTTSNHWNVIIAFLTCLIQLRVFPLSHHPKWQTQSSMRLLIKELIMYGCNRVLKVYWQFKNAKKIASMWLQIGHVSWLSWVVSKLNITECTLSTFPGSCVSPSATHQFTPEKSITLDWTVGKLSNTMSLVNGELYSYAAGDIQARLFVLIYFPSVQPELYVGKAIILVRIILRVRV